MKKKSVHDSEESKSIKTFFLYAAIVLFVILVAFIIKIFFIFQKSTFDGKSQYTISLSKKDQVEEIIAFDPSSEAIHILKIDNTQIPAASLGKFLTVIPDANIDVPQDVEITTDVTKTLSTIGFKYNFVKSDATIVDIVRLILFAKNVPLGNREIEERSFSKEQLDDDQVVDELINNLFIDNQLSAENVSIQVINATAVSGVGSRLERVLANMGANVVSVTTSRATEEHSAIKYFGPESYTLAKLKTLLDLPVSELDKETIANIVIVLGTDSLSSTKF